ncbi:hypothetical protein [Sphingomonas sp. DT-51]|uniref:hypothetical protein n=1 Tax=Sphingomonas sp. DT-51 TaxID=3396165 RepID=UPI003F5425B8
MIPLPPFACEVVKIHEMARSGVVRAKIYVAGVQLPTSRARSHAAAAGRVTSAMIAALDVLVTLRFFQAPPPPGPGCSLRLSRRPCSMRSVRCGRWVCWAALNRSRWQWRRLGARLSCQQGAGGFLSRCAATLGSLALLPRLNLSSTT